MLESISSPRTGWAALASPSTDSPSFSSHAWAARISPATVVLAAILLIAALGPILVGERAFSENLLKILDPPTLAHPLGTDDTGRDVFARLIYGARMTLGIGLAGAAISVALGCVIGGVAGYRGGWVDAALMRFVDFALAFPSLFVILLFAALFGGGLMNLVLLIGLTGWMTIARLARGTVRGLISMAYVESARAAGAGARIVFRHIGPNTGPVLLVAVLTQTNRAIVTEATISFLGLGIQPPLPTWGNLLIGAQEYVWTAPWLAIAPGLAITITMLTLFSLTAWQTGRTQTASTEATRVGQK